MKNVLTHGLFSSHLKDWINWSMKSIYFDELMLSGSGFVEPRFKGEQLQPI